MSTTKDKKKVEQRAWENLPSEFKKGDDAGTLLRGIIERVEYLMARDGRVGDDIQEQMAADIKRAVELTTLHDEALKNDKRTVITDFGPMLPMLLAEHIVPDDQRSTVGYYNLVNMAPEELRFGAAYRTLDNSPLQRTAREVRSAADDTIREFHLVNDQLYVADLVMMGNGRTAYARQSTDPVARMKTLKLWKHWERLCKEFERALATGTAAAGGNWIPTQLSQRLAELIRPELRVAMLFDMVDMPNKTYDYPILGADPVAYRVSEAGIIPTADISTGKVTFTAVKLAARTIASTEVLEDAAVALEPLILRKVSVSIGRAIEDTILNGDVAITAGGTGAQDFDLQAVQNPTFLTDRRGAWDGLRKMALISNMPNVDLSAAFTPAGLLSIRAAMKGGTGGNMFGMVGSDLAFIVNLAGYIKFLTLAEGSQASAVLTVEKYGANATILTGEIGQIAGSPVILSEFQRDDVAATGVNTTGGPNTKSVLLLAHRAAFALGRRRDISLQRSTDHRIDTDEIEYTGTWRGHFRDLYTTAAAANRSVGVGRNF